MTTRTRSASPDFQAVLRSLYGAIIDDASFHGCIDVVGNALDCHVSALHFEDMDHQRSSIDACGSVSRDELVALGREYASRWRSRNTWLHRGLGMMLSKGYGDGDAVMTQSELVATPYYQHFLRRFDVRHGLGVCLWHNGPRKVVVATFNRAATRGGFTPGAIGLISALRPHMVNAFTIHRHLAVLEDTNHCLRTAMNRVPLGVMLLGAEGQVLLANDEAERLLVASAGMARGRSNGLVFERSADRRQFLDLVQKLSGDAPDTLTRSVLVMRSDPFALPRLVLHLCAVPPRMAPLSGTRVIAFLCPLARADVQRLHLATLRSVLGLTAGELRVLEALDRHYDVKAAAEALHVAPNTVRTHLKHAFEKTGTHRQAELLALVDRVSMSTPVGTGACQADIEGAEPFPW